MRPTYEQLANKVAELAQTFPNTTRDCRYFDAPGDPCCIVGQALFDLGADGLDDIAGDSELNMDTSVNELSIYGFVAPAGRSSGAVKFLYGVQRTQDEGATWGYCWETNKHLFEGEV